MHERATLHRRLRLRRSVWLVVILAGVSAACAGNVTEPTTVTIIIEQSTVPVGGLPEPLTAAPTLPAVTPTAESTRVATTTTTTIPVVTPAAEVTAPIGDQAEGNRLLMIGDSILAGTTPRFGGLMCAALSSFGWAVEINAEPGRFIQFGHDVLDARLLPDGGQDWDVIAVFLGNNFSGDRASFAAQLDRMLQRTHPRPTVLYTMTRFSVDALELNDIVLDQVAQRPNVIVLDWAEITANAPELLAPDGIHLTERGSGELAIQTTALMGQAPSGGRSACLPSGFTDDSADPNSAVDP